MLRELATTLCLALSAPALASPAPPAPSASPLVVPAGAYRIDPSRTQVVFSVFYFPFGEYQGHFVGASGLLQFDPRDLAASKLEVRVPIEGAQTDSGAFTVNLSAHGWFDAARYPFMTFRSRSIIATSPTTADVAGDLTLHGVTRPVVFRARFSPAAVNPLDKTAATGFEVRGVIRRREFGMTRYEPFVGDQVHITIRAAFERAPS